MPENNCIAQEIGFANALTDFNRALDTAGFQWGRLGLSVVAAYGGAFLTLPAGGAGAVPGLLSFWATLVDDIDQRSAVEDVAERVADAFDALQECREDHKEGDDEPLPSVFDGFPVIPFEDPDPGADDEGIVIFDEDGVSFDEDDHGDIVIIDE